MSLKELCTDLFWERPKLICSLLGHRADMLKKLKKEKGRTEEWFFSSQGQETYKSLSSMGEKAEFFFQYLCIIARSPAKDEHLSKIAALMPIMEASDMEFSGYPAVLKKDKNPIVEYIANNSVDVKAQELGVILISLITKKEINAKRPFNVLVSYDESTDKEICFVQEIQKDILALFCIPYNESDVFMPFVEYDIISSQESDEDEDED